MNTAARYAILPLTALVAVLFILQIAFSNDLAGTGTEVKSLEHKIELVRAENRTLAHEVASASALLAIRERAGTMGLVEPKRVLTFGADTFVVAMQSQ